MSAGQDSLHTAAGAVGSGRGTGREGVVDPEPVRTGWQARQLRLHTRVSSYLVAAATLYCFVLPLDVLPLTGTMSIAFPGSILLVLAWANDRLSGRPAPPLAGGIARAALALLTWATLTIAWSAAPSVTMIGVASLALQLLSVVALVPVVPSHWLRLASAYAHGATLLGVLLLAAPPVADRAERANVGGIDENVTALALTIGCAAVAATLTRAAGPRTFVGLAELAIMSAAVLHGGSRTGFVALGALGAVAVAQSVFLAPSDGSRTAIRGVAVGCLVVVAYWIARSRGLIPDRVLTVVEGAGLHGDSQRAAIIDSYRFFQDAWFWKGIGYSADAEFLQRSMGLYKNAHSLFWATWIGLGLVGLVIFFLLLGLCLWNAMRLPTRLAVFYMAIPIAAFAATLGGDRTSAFWFPVALAAVDRRAPFGRREAGSGGAPETGSHG